MTVRQIFERYRQLVVYCIIGCSGATLDFVVYALLSNVVNLHYQIANFVSVSFGIVNNFFWNCYFNFKTKDRVVKRLISFYAVGMFGWALSAGSLWLLIEVLKLNHLVGKLCTIAFVTVVQFCLNKFYTFRK